ncbi:retinol dehydrogenase 7-like isoform X2 [Elephas maximus indicus]|uniref:retinol dehydrogenase 7-like isoform X2 n=1 Tax=Elephas maximus indicus TaxID=99487 RepID=UPI000C8129F2|nr:retinol dehydrogenase 7-like isoform X1 [Loxodonta africana]XP_049739581.1 retinol dehydrogenase 7-like isoform X2 [Elephas maximus indicus]
MSDGAGGRATEGPDVRQAGDGDYGCHPDREHCCSHPVGEGARGGQRREISSFGVKVAIIEPGFFKTEIINTETFLTKYQELWDQASPDVKDAYGKKFLDSYMKAIETKGKNSSPRLSLVTDCMEHALTACHPHTRYSPGWDAKLFYLPMSYMPTALVDAMIYLKSPRPAKAM